VNSSKESATDSNQDFTINSNSVGVMSSGFGNLCMIAITTAVTAAAGFDFDVSKRVIGGFG
jgi:hypothetical protein